MTTATALTRELYGEEGRQLVDYAEDPTFTYQMATIFGNDAPAPARRAGFDKRLEPTSIFAYYVNPGEVVDLYPREQRERVLSLLKEELGTTEPYIGLNPKLLRMPKNFVYDVIKHEKGHGAQPKGKLLLKGLHARTRLGDIPLGEMLIEGWNEYGLERNGEKAPSRYFDEEHGYGRTPYSQYRQFVYEIEGKSKGITRQIFRAAQRGGLHSAVRLIDSIPNIHDIMIKYAASLNNRNN